MTIEQIIKLWHAAGFSTMPSGAALVKLERFVELVRAEK